MKTSEKNPKLSLKKKRSQFSINIRKKQNRLFFRESRKAYVEKIKKKGRDQEVMEDICSKYIHSKIKI